MQIAIMAKPPTTAPAIAPLGVLEELDLGVGVGLPARTEGKGFGVGGDVAGVLQAGGPMTTRLEVVDCWLWDSVNCYRSLSTMRYAELRNGMPKRGMSFALTPWRLLIRTSTSVELDRYSWPSGLISTSGTTSWWLGTRMSRPG